MALGVDISFATRVSTTLYDIVSMQPLFGSIFGIGFLIAMLVGHLIAKWVKILPDLVFALAGLASVAVTLWSLTAAFQSPPLARRANGMGF